MIDAPYVAQPDYRQRMLTEVGSPLLPKKLVPDLIKLSDLDVDAETDTTNASLFVITGGTQLSRDVFGQSIMREIFNLHSIGMNKWTEVDFAEQNRRLYVATRQSYNESPEDRTSLYSYEDKFFDFMSRQSLMLSGLGSDPDLQPRTAAAISKLINDRVFLIPTNCNTLGSHYYTIVTVEKLKLYASQLEAALACAVKIELPG